MEFLKEIFRKDITKRIIVLSIIIFFFIILRGMLNLFLLTFLFSYITYSIQKVITEKIDKYMKKLKVKETIVTIIIYIVMSVLIVFVLYRYIPLLVIQIEAIFDELSKFDFGSVAGGSIVSYIMPYIASIDFSKISKLISVDNITTSAKYIGTLGYNVFVALILSLFFMLEKDKIKHFASKFDNSRVEVVYKYTKDFGVNFLNSFGKVIQAQLIIAFTNCVLSTIAFWIMDFPQVLGLGVMVFFFSLVPVAGTVVSLIPLSIIAYTVGGFKEIAYVLILIAILHSLESYVLNPRFMADKTELPVFIVFITLLVSEHFMGGWGLLLGVPLLMFILDFLNVKVNSEKKGIKIKNSTP